MARSRMVRAGAAIALLALLAGCTWPAPAPTLAGDAALDPQPPGPGEILLAEQAPVAGDGTVITPDDAPALFAVSVSVACVGPSELEVDVAGVGTRSFPCSAGEVSRGVYNWLLEPVRPAGALAARVHADARTHWALVLSAVPAFDLPPLVLDPPDVTAGEIFDLLGQRGAATIGPISLPAVTWADVDLSCRGAGTLELAVYGPRSAEHHWSVDCGGAATGRLVFSIHAGSAEPEGDYVLSVETSVSVTWSLSAFAVPVSQAGS